MSAIEISNLTKRFGDVTALDDLSFSVPEGEIFGFLGPNGAGKSTTINVLLGFTQPSAGSARVFGHDAQAESKAIRQRTGALLEGYGVYDRITAREHVERAIRAKGADDDPDEILERVGIPETADRKAGGFSKGMAQRMAIGMALVGDPDLLVLDEPSTGLDPNGTRELRDVIREENRRGATVFFSSHLIDQVEAVCDRVGILKDGKMVTEGSVTDLRAQLDAATVTVTVERAPPESLLSELRGIDGVEEVEATDNQVLVSARGGDAKLRALNRVERAGVGFADFTTDDPSLEEIFEVATLGPREGRGGRGGRAPAEPSAEGEL
ncbi:ABC transporter ATP-binding protein [Halosimplex carlsbadense 2-9-1]|uniref:ABC transporter ATP-binding protein n=1 Tax=Halosimplex carlsbadense 2-9-1 TaxID=797114 RepID=M0CIP6_9EURY|nr:ABC transporter ATP-binding protein [Halosimplex carlsbadense]ELZ21769.1 ABC transporter ATP-binding protein [Halosimplex carlsbadense 2-9-1]